MDLKARLAARERERFYPPIPFGETNFLDRSDKDIYDHSGGVDGGWTYYYENDREAAYWSWFWRTHPLPPEDIERQQVEIEETILASKTWKGVRQKDIDSTKNIEKERAIELNCPPEALTDDALHWAYLFHQHQQYQQYSQRIPAEVVQAIAHNAGDNLSQLTNSITAEQIKAANAWKIAYLQRLRREKTDEQYIKAYLQAWNLSTNQVFGP